jgi:TolB-like protein/Flp pilus assembly protein TadD
LSIFSQLKQRNVFKVGVAYVIVAWIVIQIADVIAPQLNLPEWTPRMITFVILLGFPVSLVMAWALDLTPQGVVKAEGSDTPIYVFAAAFVAIALFWFFGRQPEPMIAPSDLTAAVTQQQVEAVEPAGLPSIAVLPFKNMSMDEANEPFTIGIHDDLLTQLCKIRTLKTISRTSVMRYRDSEKSSSEIANELGVSFLLEGGVQRMGDMVRINVQLTKADSDENLWAETYDRELTAASIFAIQSEIAISIADELQTTLSSEDQARLNSAPTQNLDALQAYFTGKLLADQRGEKTIKSAIKQFEKAISLDPEFALAHAGLAYAWLLLPEYSVTVDAKQSRDTSNAAIARALELDPELPSGLAFKGWSKMAHEYDWATAEQLLRRALELQGTNSDALHWLSHVLSWQGRHEEAIATARQAVEIDPYSPLMNMNLAYILMDDGQFDETSKFRQRTLELRPNYTELWRNTWLTFMRAGEYENATGALVNWSVGTGRDVDLAQQLGDIIEQSQISGEMVHLPTSLLTTLGIGNENLGQVYAAVGDTESAIATIRIALDERVGSRSVLSMKINPLYDSIRQDPRFIAMQKEVNLYP